jgi:hypothetical protein
MKARIVHTTGRFCGIMVSPRPLPGPDVAGSGALDATAGPARTGAGKVGDEVPRKGRARRFREARELKQGFDDDLFSEGSGSLADVEEGTVDDDKGWDDDDDEHGDDWDADDPLAIDERRSGADGGRRAS